MIFSKSSLYTLWLGFFIGIYCLFFLIYLRFYYNLFCKMKLRFVNQKNSVTIKLFTQSLIHKRHIFTVHKLSFFLCIYIIYTVYFLKVLNFYAKFYAFLTRALYIFGRVFWEKKVLLYIVVLWIIIHNKLEFKFLIYCL